MEAERTKPVRSKEMRLEGEGDRVEYLRRKAEMSAVMAFRETPLGEGSGDAEVALGQVADVGQVITEGEPAHKAGAAVAPRAGAGQR
jgi:hypothetical protein